jgi:hypothetical protein
MRFIFYGLKKGRKSTLGVFNDSQAHFVSAELHQIIGHLSFEIFRFAFGFFGPCALKNGK